MKQQLKLTALTVALAFGLAACGGSSSKNETVTKPTPTPTPTPAPTGFDFAATEMITNLGDDVILAGYKKLNSTAEKLVLATMTLIETPTQANLEAAQEAWKVARTPWEQGEAHIFGPIDALSIDPHLDTWPLNTNDLKTVIEKNPTISAATIKGFNDDVQGFHTMEYLLFGDGVEDNVKKIEELNANEREYLKATAEVFREYTNTLENAWTTNYKPDDSASKPYVELFKGANNDVYGSQTAVIEELVNGMIGIVDEVGNGKIADPFGAAKDKADTSLVESQYSWNSLRDFTDNIVGVLNVYNGEFEGEADKQGLYDFVAAGDKALADRVKTEIEASIATIKAISGTNDMPFRQAIKDDDGRVRIQAAVDALTKLKASLETDVVNLQKKWNGK